MIIIKNVGTNVTRNSILMIFSIDFYAIYNRQAMQHGEIITQLQLQCDTKPARYMLSSCVRLSVRPSVRPSQAGIVAKILDG